MSNWMEKLADIQSYTDDFLVPFRAMFAIESDDINDSVPWCNDGEDFCINFPLQ